MNQGTANLNENELNAWETFEVGSLEEIRDYLKSSPTPFIKNLTIIAEWEDKKRINPSAIAFNDKKIFDMTSAYLEFIWGRKEKAILHLKKYASSETPLICLTFLTFGLRVGIELDDYQFSLSWMNLAGPSYEKYFCKEKIHCLYGLKKYPELINYFKSVYNFLDKDTDVMLKVGLTLQALGKFKESELLLDKIEDKIVLPSFDDKKKDFNEIISKIPSMENKKDNLSFEELKNLGFAYLFNSQYDKAEEVFKKATLITV